MSESAKDFAVRIIDPLPGDAPSHGANTAVHVTTRTATTAMAPMAMRRTGASMLR